MRFVLEFLLLSLLAAWCSCSASSVQRLPPGALTERPDPLREFAGNWRGTSFSTYEMATVKISFEIRQNGIKFKGDYHCAPGNIVYTNNIQRGWVHGEITARAFSVAMEDTSWCLFFMNEFYRHGRVGITLVTKVYGHRQRPVSAEIRALAVERFLSGPPE